MKQDLQMLARIHKLLQMELWLLQAGVPNLNFHHPVLEVSEKVAG